MDYKSRIAVLIVVFLTWAPIGTFAAGDQLVLGGDAFRWSVPLPRGAVTAEVSSHSRIVGELTYLADGQLLALRDVENSEGEVVGFALARIEPDGTVIDLGNIELAADALVGETPSDLAIDSQGRLFVLSQVATGWNPPDGYTRLIQVSPGDGSTIAAYRLSSRVEWIARSLLGLWASAPGGLYRLDPDTGTLTLHSASLLAANDGESDSTGALWLYSEGVCSPPCFFFQRFDPATGDVQNLQQLLEPPSVVVRDLTVQRGCRPSTSDLCLQGGRFRAQVTWRDFRGREGEGFLTSARSADSGIFWFFGAANWELMVKVLDGCDLGGHFWVFASGSTSVQYTLTVTDLQTQEVRVYDNPLGQTAMTVTDTAAFACP